MPVDIPGQTIYNAKEMRGSSFFPVLLLITGVLRATESPAGNSEPLEPDQTTSVNEAEEKGIIPPQAETAVSTQPVTPVTQFPEKRPYEQAKEELIRTFQLWNSGNFEAASDTALEAYEDLVAVRRAPGVNRKKVRKEIQQAAEIYVEASITYIKKSLQQLGRTPETLEDARSRLEDLRDVAREYKKLNRMVDEARDKL